MADSSATYDILLRGGHVIDPANNIDGVSDVGISDGKIAAVGPNLDASQSNRVLDVDGLDCRLTLRAGKVEWNSDARGMPLWDAFPGDYMAQPV